MKRETRRRIFAQWTELHVSVLALLGALALADDATVLLETGEPWRPLAAPMFSAAALGLLGAVSPWLWTSVPLGVRRAALWGGTVLGTATSIGAMLPLELGALAGSHLLLLAALLSELNGGPAVLRWFWLSFALAAATIVIYYTSVPLRPVGD